MREIKFRAWVQSKKILCDVLTLDFNEKTAQLPIETEVNVPYWWDVTSWSFEDIKLLQYTGLTDKNGVEIYEGYILKWDEKEWGHPFNELVEWNFDQLDMRERDWAEFCEVIGNVYENPSLLDQ